MFSPAELPPGPSENPPAPAPTLTARLGVLIAVVLGAAIWLTEDFGGILTGQGTDPNSGLLLIVLAAAFWPLAVTG
jgi:hypothetical protein